MGEHDEKKTWWLWDGDFDGIGYRVVIEVNTVITSDGARVDTPVGYFGEYEGHGHGIPGGGSDRMMIENEEFAKLRAEGAIKPLTPIN